MTSEQEVMMELLKEECHKRALELAKMLMQIRRQHPEYSLGKLIEAAWAAWH